MAENSSILSFKKLLLGLIIFLMLVLLLETMLFSKAYLVADKSTICSVFKKIMMERHHSADVVIFGDSRTLAIDAKSLEESFGGNITAYNYSLYNIGTDLLLYLSLHKYLSYCKRPELIIASTSIEHFCQGNTDVFNRGPENYEFKRFRRFFSIWDIWGEIPRSKKKIFLATYLTNAIPSYDYAFWIIQSLKDHAVLSSLRHANNIIQHMQQTNGQIIYNEDAVANDVDIAGSLPTDPLIKNIKNFERFVALCDKNDIRIVFFLMPIHHMRYKKMAELGWFDYIDQEMDRLQRKYRRFEYHKIGDFNYEGKYFGDWSHLNKKGADKFNWELKSYARNTLEGIVK